MAHPLSRALLLAVTLTAVLAMTHRAARAAGPAVVAISPASASATVGDDIAIDITVTNVPEQPGLAGYDVTVTWDPAVLDLVSITDSGWLTSGQNLVFPTAAQVPNIGTRAAAKAACSLFFAVQGFSTTAPRALVHAVFRAKAPGTTTISLAEGDPPSSLVNPSGGDIAATLTGGTVTVSALAVAAATDIPAPPATSTPKPSSTPAVQATDTPAATASPTRPAESPVTPSTKPAQATLSRVEVPPTGTGAGDKGTAWWIPGLSAAGAALLGTGALIVFRWTRRRTTQR